MIGLSPPEMKEEQDTITVPKKSSTSIIFVSSLIIGISIVLSQFVFYDSNFEESEKLLQKLDSDYKIGKTLTNKEFDLYCQLLEKIWKKHLKACYCKDGIKNPTPGTPLRFLRNLPSRLRLLPPMLSKPHLDKPSFLS